jgi:hypothetical protein
MTLGLATFGWLRAQQTPKPVVVMVAVTDRYARYVLGLNQSDFRVFEDGIPRKIVSLATPDGTGRVLPERKGKSPSDQEAFDSIRYDLENSYTITYHPDPANQNRGFRKIRIEVVPDAAGNFRVRHRPGYRPE